MIDQNTTLKDGDRVRLKVHCNMGKKGDLGRVHVGFAGVLAVAMDNDDPDMSFIETTLMGKRFWAVELVELVYEPPIDDIVELVKEGLEIDGGHHKQWYLDQVLQQLMGPAYQPMVEVYEYENDVEWDHGIAP